MDEHRVSHWGIPEPLPEVEVLYTPEIKFLTIKTGPNAWSRNYESESIANYMVAHYDKDNRLVALDLEGAEKALEPFIDAALRSDDKKTGILSKRSAFYLNPGNNWGGPLKDVAVFYNLETGVLRIQADGPVGVHRSEAAARGLLAHYDADGSLVAIDLEGAELLLKPLLDAVRNREKERAA